MCSPRPRRTVSLKCAQPLLQRQPGEARHQGGASALGSRQNIAVDSRKETGAWERGVRDDQAQLVKFGAVSG